MGHHNHSKDKKDTRTIIEELSHENILKCYQCGKCTAGCPMAFKMDIHPHQIIRSLQMESLDEVLKSQAIWYCSGCQTCYTRCPQEVSIAKVMDALCRLSVDQKKVNKKSLKIKKFHDSFLNGIKWTGLSNEVALVADYKLRSKNFFQDVLLAPVMFFKGKLKLFPRFIKNTKAMKKIFNKTREEVR